MSKYKNPLHEAAERFPMTELWNDSCGVGDLKFAIERGAVGATSNPIIVGNVLRKEMDLWKERLNNIINKEMLSDSDEEICWQISKEAGLKGAEILEPIFNDTFGKKGRQALQVHPRYFRNAEKTISHATELSGLAPNILIKMPVSASGIRAIEECTFAGISVNGTVCFGLPQAICVAEAVEKGLKRREKEGLPIDNISPSCTIMVGRINDWLKKNSSEKNIPILPEYLDWGGVAVFKKTYRIYKEKAYRLRLLVASNNSHYLWSNFIGADTIITVNPIWWRRMEGCRMEIRETIDDPVDPVIIKELYENLPEFRKIYDADGLDIEGFEEYGAFNNTMREFFTGYDAFLTYLRNFIIPEK